MTDQIAEIRARHEAGARGMLPLPALAEALDDRAFLLAEVERLREENKRGHAAHKAACMGGDLLREEIKRLRAALEDIARGDYSDPMCKQTPEARARAALEGISGKRLKYRDGVASAATSAADKA